MAHDLEHPGHEHDDGHGDHGHDDGHGDDGHGHGHGHDGHEQHDHGRPSLRHRLGHLLTPHSHDAADKVDQAMEGSREGIRALWASLLVLGLTAALQALVAAWSGSVALLGDTLHNVADALTAVPLGVAFLLGRRPANRRYTYGYGRAEDLAGIVIVLTIAVSAALAAYAAVERLVHPAEVTRLPFVAVAGLIGFAGNELVARLRIRTGRRIGSAALVADGLHARTDGFTSLAVLLGAAGVAIGWRWADPLVGLLITIAILVVLKDAAREVYRRLMDAVDPDLMATAEQTLAHTPGVRRVAALRMRWIGHRLHAETDLVVDAGLTLADAHRIAMEAEHRLLHAVPRLTAATVHPDPDGPHVHAPLDHHRGQLPAS